MIIKNKKILVIGGAGFIGSHTVELLLKESPKKIIIFDNFERGKLKNLSKSLKDPKVELFKDGGDILKLDLLNSAMKDVDYVFHFAALWLLHCNDYPESAFDVNIRGTFNVINLCVKNKIKKLIFSSSASVYGDAINVPMTEDHPFNNRNFYGATKISCEAMCRAFYDRYNLNYVGLRYMNVYGPHQICKGPMSTVIGIFEDHYKRKKALPVVKPGTQSRRFTHIDDTIKVCFSAWKKNLCRHYSISNKKSFSIIQVAKMFKSRKCTYFDSKTDLCMNNLDIFPESQKITLMHVRQNNISVPQTCTVYAYFANPITYFRIIQSFCSIFSLFIDIFFCMYITCRTVLV